LRARNTCVRKDSVEVAQTLKLALIGTHGVGKTTLAYEICSLLKKANHNVDLVTEVARRSPFPINEATTLDGQLWILHAQIAKELDTSAHAHHLICDRSVLDNYCYLVNKFGRQPQLEQWLSWWLESYSLLVSVPPMADGIPPDGFRSENLEFQDRIHDLIGEVLSEHPFSVHHNRVLWLDRRDRRVWGEIIFAAAAPLLRPALLAKAVTAR
jgi:energy-coupling factor transporter ATP-binding protein EcfA2